MSQPPNYVVRQESGGKLKLLLVRDPRATHVAKVSPLKKQTSVGSQTTPPSLSTVAAVSTSPSTSEVAVQRPMPSIQRRLQMTEAAAGPSSSSRGAPPSPASLTQAASDAMAMASVTKGRSQQLGSSNTIMAKGKTCEGRVKGGKIVKLHSQYQNRIKPTSKSHSPSAAGSHLTIPHSSAKTQHVEIDSKTVSKKTVSSPRHQTSLPVSRIRTIMRTNVQSSHTTNVSQDSVTLVTKATELFIAQLAKDAHKVAMAAATRDVSYGHLSKTIRSTKRTEFLHDVVPEKVVVSDYLASLGNHVDHTHKTAVSSSTSH